MFRGTLFFSVCFYFIHKIFFKFKKIDYKKIDHFLLEDEKDTILLPEEEWGQFIDIEIY